MSGNLPARCHLSLVGRTPWRAPDGKKIMRYLGFFAAAAVALASCGGGGSSSVPTGSSSTSAINVALVDAPFATSGITVTAVNLGILKVETVGSGAAPTAFATNASPQVVNILNYTSVSAPLSFAGTIPTGTYTQLRFVLDTATTTISYTDANGTAHNNVPLSIPSATTSGYGNNSSTDAGDGQGTAGVKVNVALTAAAGTTYGFVVDFNALHSIVVTGGSSPQFTMKPVLVATAQATSGAIAGTVKSQTGTAVSGAEVDAQQGGTTVNSTVTAADGTFTINALPAGSYTLVVKNTYTTLGGTANTALGYDASVGATLTVSASVIVTAGQTAQAGTITD
jgi:hypothetical protein